MIITLHRLLCSVLLAWCATGADAATAGLPDGTVPDGLGVNIHFTDARPGELEQIVAGGFRWARMDFGWGGTEREKGVYDFSAYDRLLTALDQHGIRTLFILDYDCRFYDGGESPRSDEGRAAFCAWTAAALKHFAGRGVVWEMFNEPNGGFWKPKPDVDAYARLALAVGKTIRAVAPKELYVGPATSEIDLRFLEACFKAGCLEYWDAVSVHPYRHKAPETAAEEYRTLRQLIVRYAPAGKRLPILSGEWGYSSGGWGDGYDEALQGRYLPREWLTNLANDIPISIWYDWHEDGEDPKEGEHHFGSVRYPYRTGQAEVYAPKPAFLAAKTLTTELKGLRFNKRLITADPDDQVLLFAQGDQLRVVAWTLAKSPHPAVIPASAGAFRAVGHLGDARPLAVADAKGLTVTLDGTPLYLAPEQPNDLLRVAVAWGRAELEYRVHLPDRTEVALSFTNPLAHALEIDTGRDPSGGPITVPPGKRMVAATALTVRERQDDTRSFVWSFAGLGALRQDSRVIVANPLTGMVLPVTRRGDLSGDPSAAVNELPVRVLNPSGEAFSGRIVLTEVEGLQVTGGDQPLDIPAGSGEGTVRFTLSAPPAAGYRAGAVISAAGVRALTIAPHRYRIIDDFAQHGASSLHTAYHIYADGDKQVASEQRYGLGAADAQAPVGGAVAITYRFDKGWKFLCFGPSASKALDGRPSAIGMWVKSDGSGNLVRLRVVDATGQTFQPSAGKLVDPGWGYREFVIAGPDAGHWGGANDGVPHHPLKLDTLLLIDQAEPARPSAGTVELAAPTLIE
jgi:hypothetical protein